MLPKQRIYVLGLDLRTKQRFFPHIALAEWFFTSQTQRVYRAVRAESLYYNTIFTDCNWLPPVGSGRLLIVIQCNHSL